MKPLLRNTLALLAAIVLPAIGVVPALAEQPVNGDTAKLMLQAEKAYGSLPMSFEPNRGQTDEQVLFLSRGPGYNLFLTRNESVLVLGKGSLSERRSPSGPARPGHPPDAFKTPSVVRMRLLDANSDIRVQGANELPGKTNYLRSRDPAKWNTNVEQFARVEYHDVYPGVDLAYYGKGPGQEARLEHDFIVRPGSDPARIKLGFEGVEGMELNASGDLVLKLAEGGELLQHAPVIYQEYDGTRKTIEGGYVLLASGPSEPPRLGFQVAEYDRARTLYIDPVLSYSTYLGGSDYDFGYGITVDTSNCAYITGWSFSAEFPVKKARQGANSGEADVFVAKLNSTGTTLVYSTFIGGSGSDFGTGIAVDGTGAAYVTGYTDSADFPATTGAISTTFSGTEDAFVFKLNAAGTALTYCTYLGGTAEDRATAIAIDSTGAAYVTGYTLSADFPTASAYQAANAGSKDAFVAKINAAGTTLVYSTYLGGTGEDYADAIKVDSSNQAHVAGSTNSADYPTVNPCQSANAGGWDAFMATLAADGLSLVYSTYMGGAGDDFARAIAVAADSASPNHVCAYITGTTSSDDYPTAFPAGVTPQGVPYQALIKGNYDSFVTKVDPALTTTATLVYSTYLGGEDFDQGNAIAVDSSNNVYVAGQTWSDSFPVKGSPFQAMLNGLCDGFVSELNSTGSTLVTSSYLGGADSDLVMGLALDSSNNLYVTGYTYSTDYPVVTPIAGHISGGTDVFVAKIATATPAGPDLIVSSITPPASGVIGQKVTITTKVVNQGVVASAPCRIGLYLSTAVTLMPTPTDRAIFLGGAAVPKLKPDAGSSINVSVPLPPGIPTGPYYIVGVVDRGKAVEESDETNNSQASAKLMTVYRPRADLISASVAGPSKARLGRTITISSKVKNQGYGNAKNFYVGLYLSTDTTVDTTDILVGKRPVSLLVPGGNSSAGISVQIPTTLTPGTYYLGVIADPDNDVVELDKTNNSKVGGKIVITQ